MRGTPRVKLTYDDLVLFPDDGMRHELIDGAHYVTPPPVIRHQAIVGNLHFIISTWLEIHPLGRVYFAPLDLVFTRFDVVEPDLLYASKQRLAQIATEPNLQGAPELVVEVGSPRTRKRDATIKLRLYERSGIDEYWIVDPRTDVVCVYRREGDRFAPPIELSREAGDVLTSPLFPGLEMPLARIFRD